MSGSTIGGVVGAVFGFYFGNPQLGWMIGSAIGGALDPQKIQMPSLGDAQTQTSNDGIPIPVVYGRPPKFAGNLIAGENKARKYRVKQKQEGKGGPEVYTDAFRITIAIGICEGPIAGISRVWRNGTLVYDIRPESIIQAETRSFASKARFYLGTEDQLPDPALEAIHGVGDTCYHRGMAYMVIVDDDVTETRGAIARYEFEVVKAGTIDSVVINELLVPRLSRFANGGPLADGDGNYDWRCFWATKDGSIQSPWLANILLARLWFEQQTGLTAPTKYVGYSANTSGWVGNSLSIDIETIYPVVPQQDIEPFESVTLAYQFEDASEYYPTAIVELCPLGGSWVGAANGVIARKMTFEQADSFPHVAAVNCSSFGDEGWMGVLYPMCLQARRRPMQESHGYGDPCDLQERVLLPDAPGMTVDCDGVVEPVVVYGTPVDTYRVLFSEQVDSSGGNRLITREEVGPAVSVGDPNYLNEAFWEAAYANAVANGLAPPGWTYEAEYPGIGTRALTTSRSVTTIEIDEISLQEVVEDIALRCDVPSSAIVASALGPDIIPGYLVAVPGTGSDCTRPLQEVFFFDMPEEDGRIVCRKRGGDVVGEVFDDECVDVDTDDEDVRAQQVEYPKKVNLAYPDPDGEYGPTTQTFAREAYDVLSTDEVTVSTPIPFDKDQAAQRVDIMGKVAWAQAEGTQKRVLPIEYAIWTPGDCYEHNGKRWLIQRQEVSDGEVTIEAVYDRRTAYQSIAIGVAPRPPATPTSQLRGPTRLEVIDVSPLRDQDDAVGVYLQVTNILDGWEGGIISARVDQAATFTPLATILDPSIMGRTTTALAPSHPFVFDGNDSVTVQVHGGEPEGVTFLQLLNEANAAIIDDEIVQFQTAVEVDLRTFQLTGLTRARNGSSVAAHPPGARFVLLDAATFVPLPSSWIGRSVTYRVLSVNTPGETSYLEFHAFNGNSQREWAPIAFDVVQRDDRASLSWIGRGRLGTSAAPYHSSFFAGYRVTITGGGTTRTYDTSEPRLDLAKLERSAAWGGLSPLQVEIVALNRITGASAPLTGSIP